MEKKSDTEWELELPVGEYSVSHSIEVTKEGIEFDYNLISWEEIDKARRILTIE